jgi:uncharacterized protein
MRQLFLLILLFFASQWLVKVLRRASSHADAPRSGPFDARGTRSTARAPRAQEARHLSEPMVRCAVCGVHAPKSDSIVAAGQHFCCVEHAQRYAARPAGRDAR